MHSMGAREQAESIRVIKVSKDGANYGWDLLNSTIAELSQDGFVAVDTEFSGLGSSDPRTQDADLSVRYAAIRELVNTHAILSLGVALFNPTTNSDSKPPTSYTVTSFDFLLRCNSGFTLTAAAGEFLVSHGYDFNDMFLRGISYNRASTEKPLKGTSVTQEEAGIFRWGPIPRGLLWRIGRAGTPLVLHNGFLDLAFCYAAFHGPLPETLDGFVSKLLDCVPAGYYDTKVIAKSSANEKASFLSYVYAKAVLAGGVSVRNRANFPPQCLTDPQPRLVMQNEQLCNLYALQGYCPAGVKCVRRHDPFEVVEKTESGAISLDISEARKCYKKQAKKEKRKRDQEKQKRLNKKAKKRLRELEDGKEAAKVLIKSNFAANGSFSERELLAADKLLTDSDKSQAKACQVRNDQTFKSCLEESERAKDMRDIVDGISNEYAMEKESINNSAPNDQESLVLAKNELSLPNESITCKASKCTTSALGAECSRIKSTIQGVHSAGWDAFCTGYAFGGYRNRIASDELLKQRNKIHLPKKSNPLFLCKSKFLDGSELSGFLREAKASTEASPSEASE